MKKTLLYLTICFLSASLQAQTDQEKFVKIMEKTLANMDTMKTAAQWLEKANAFERIAQKEPKEWLPAYYVAYCQTMAFNTTQDKTTYELLATRADEFVKKADALQPNNSEIYVLKSMVASLFIRLNPMVNGQKYGPIASTYLENGNQLDVENPRYYLQKALTLYFTPPQWGGDKAQAKELLKIAATKFGVFKPASSIHPNWGKAVTDYFSESWKD